MLRAAVLLCTVIVVAGCAAGTDGAPLRILSLGDSYTVGESVAEADRWPNQLAVLLEEEGFGPVEVEIVARTGWTTADLDAGIDIAEPQGPYGLVTLLIGVNNQFRGLDPEAYRSELAALLDRAQAFSEGPVVVVSIPDWGVTPFGGRYDREQVALEIDEFNAIARAEADRVGAAWVYITPISRSEVAGLVAEDGLHPSGLQYGLWAEEILPVVVELVGR